MFLLGTRSSTCPVMARNNRTGLYSDQNNTRWLKFDVPAHFFVESSRKLPEFNARFQLWKNSQRRGNALSNCVLKSPSTIAATTWKLLHQLAIRNMTASTEG